MISDGVHAADADFAAGLVPFSRADHGDAALLQSRDIGARGRMSPHDAIHGWSDGKRRLGRQAHGRQKIIRLSGGKARNEACARRGYENELRPTRKFDVAHGGLSGRIPQFRSHRSARYCLQSKSSDELLRGGRHDDLDLRPTLTQTAHELRALVGGDAAGDAEENSIAVHGCAFTSPPIIRLRSANRQTLPCARPSSRDLCTL